MKSLSRPTYVTSGTSVPWNRTIERTTSSAGRRRLLPILMAPDGDGMHHSSVSSRAVNVKNDITFMPAVQVSPHDVERSTKSASLRRNIALSQPHVVEAELTSEGGRPLDVFDVRARQFTHAGIEVADENLQLTLHRIPQPLQFITILLQSRQLHHHGAALRHQTRDGSLSILILLNGRRQDSIRFSHRVQDCW